ncbi:MULTISPECIES: lysozyme inhibitor LprI family protein [unclassified Sphingobium]|uniref:lysozyme inhibitor LprI family protein n=1 Tax=unclassified Sphingobium TaxID=2611147 RepID=UPI0035A658F9
MLLLAAASSACANVQVQDDQILCAGETLARADAAMNQQWKSTYAFMKSMDAKGVDFGYAATLLESQRAWLKYRDAQCNAEGAIYYGTSIAICETRLTNARTIELKDLISIN